MAEASLSTTECKLCSTTFNHPDQATAHYKGKQHQKRLKANGLLTGSPTSGSLSGSYPRQCPVCPEVELTSVYMEESHRSGTKHKKREEKGKEKEKEKGQETDSDSNEIFYDAVDGKEAESSSDSDIGDVNLDYCPICRRPFNHVDSAKSHYKGAEHQKKVDALRYYEEKKDAGESDIPFCDVCLKLCNTMEQLALHKESPAHRAVAERTIDRLIAQSPAKRSKEKAPKKDHPPLVTEGLTPKDRLARREPRSYQKELYKKAIATNVVIFLPTGMGKTLTSTLVVSHMLQEYPTRQVIFIVDRKLLVFQQGAAFKDDLCEVKIGSDNHHVRVALVCGDRRRLATGCHHLHQHDIIVITAGSYQNLLKTGELRWDDVSLLVFDEAHHCVKRHPYRMIMEVHYRGKGDDYVEDGEVSEEDKVLHKPKILGLTASPAGDVTVKKTEAKVDKLLGDMDCKLAKVTESKSEYDEHKPKTTIRCVHAPLTAIEDTVLDLLNQHARQCLKWLQTRLDVSQLAEVDLADDKPILDEGVGEKIAAAFNVYTDEEDLRSDLKQLMEHVSGLFTAAGEVNASGVHAAKERIQKLITPEKIKAFPSVSWPLLDDAVAAVRRDKEDMPSGPKKVVEELVKLPWTEPEYKRKDGTYKLYAMILVMKREIAIGLEKHLNDHPELKSLGLKTTRVTGHGKSTADKPRAKGMTTRQQEEAMKAVREGKFNIIVATNVAEEGVDLPECKLVIQTSVPRTLTSLVQVRGRARASKGELVAICRVPGQEEDVRKLEQQEKNMEEATTNIVARQERNKKF